MRKMLPRLLSVVIQNVIMPVAMCNNTVLKRFQVPRLAWEPAWEPGPLADGLHTAAAERLQNRSLGLLLSVSQRVSNSVASTSRTHLGYGCSRRSDQSRQLNNDTADSKGATCAPTCFTE
jgi:hypothetical protein